MYIVHTTLAYNYMAQRESHGTMKYIGYGYDEPGKEANNTNDYLQAASSFIIDHLNLGGCHPC